MLDSNKVSNDLGEVGYGGLAVPDLDEVRAFTARLRLASADGDAGLGIDLLDAIETLKSVGCAVQAVITDDVATSIRHDREARQLPRSEWDRGLRRRLHWRAGNLRTEVAGIWGSRGRWCMKCHTPWTCCDRGG